MRESDNYRRTAALRTPMSIGMVMRFRCDYCGVQRDTSGRKLIKRQSVKLWKCAHCVGKEQP